MDFYKNNIVIDKTQFTNQLLHKLYHFIFKKAIKKRIIDFSKSSIFSLKYKYYAEISIISSLVTLLKLSILSWINGKLVKLWNK